MNIFTLLVATLLPLLAVSNPIKPRAGGPEFIPIPSNCTVINPLPHAGGSSANIGSVSGYMVAPNFTTAHYLYGFYLPVDTYHNQSTTFEMCLQQCNGYGPQGICKSALLAYDVTRPLGSSGVVNGYGCMMFDAYLDPNKFVNAPKGQYGGETAGSIYCPEYANGTRI